MAKAEQERQAAIIRAEGEAEAAELISKAMIASGTGMIEVHTVYSVCKYVCMYVYLCVYVCMY